MSKYLFFLFKQKTAYEMRISDRSSDVCSSDLDQLEAMLGPLADAGVDVMDASIRRFWQPAFEGSPLNLAGWAKRLTGKPSIAVGSLGLTGSASDTLKIGRAHV